MEETLNSILSELQHLNKDQQELMIAPQSTKRRGPEPGIVKAANFFGEMRIVARSIKKLHMGKKSH